MKLSKNEGTSFENVVVNNLFSFTINPLSQLYIEIREGITILASRKN